MIARLQGELIDNTISHVVVDVAGVGYELEVPTTTGYGLAKAGETVTLHTHCVVREDAQLLYGFMAKRDRNLFRVLLRVNGVGAKVALAMLSAMDADQLVQCLIDGNKVALTSVNGIGPRLAERILVESPSLLKDWVPAASIAVTKSGPGLGGPFAQDAIGALIALGYQRKKAEAAVAAVDVQADSVEALLRHALQKGAAS